ncbi:MAG: winged helix-turn-helix domain-containing protein [Alkalispirochaeta sp.]
MGIMLVVDDGSYSVRLAGEMLQRKKNTVYVSPSRAAGHVGRNMAAIVVPADMVGGPLWLDSGAVRPGRAVRIGYGAVEHMERALLLEADDYLCCPWTAVELLVRVQRLVYGVEGNRTGRIITLGDETYVLSTVQAAIWRTLVRQPGRVVSRDVLAGLAEIGVDGRIGSRAVDMHIARLRRSLGVNRSVVETVRGRGYRYNGDTINTSNLNVDK